LSAIIPGSTVPWVTRKLGLSSHEPPAPPAILAIESRQPLTGEIASFYVDEGLAVAGATIGELEFPEGAAVSLVVRGNDLIAPKDSTTLSPGDHVYIISRPGVRAFMQLLCGMVAEEARRGRGPPIPPTYDHRVPVPVAAARPLVIGPGRKGT